jgi:mitochondrial-processing peptidase subunit alpha
LIAEQRKLDAVTPGSIAEFISGAFSADRIVIAGSNISHEELVRLAEVSLGDFASTGSAVTVPSQYTGGSVSIPGDGPGHFAIGFEGVSWADDDLVPVCVLHTLLGGGGSFSSGGPGKGMYTRLFSEILNRREWVSSAIAFNHCYSDTGLFGIHASCQDPANLNNLIEVVTEQVGKMANTLGSDELERAKNMTKSSLVMNLESRAVVCEDIGRQILGSGKYVGPEQLVGAIDAVDEGAIRRVARRMLVSKPSIVMHGEEYATHAFDQIESSVKAQSKIAA